MIDCTAIATLRHRIKVRASDPRLMLVERMVPGLADDLRLIGEAFTSLHQAVQLLARAEIAREGKYPLSRADYHDLVTLAGEGG